MSNCDSENKTPSEVELSEQDSNFFDTIEGIIVGILSFVVNFFLTTKLIILYPRKSGEILVSPKRETSIIRPYTYLAVSSFLYGYVIDLNTWHLTKLDSEPLIFLSFSELFKISVPVVAFVVLYGHLLEYLIDRKSKQYKNQIIELICYSVSAQLQVLALLFYIYSSEGDYYVEWYTTIGAVFIVAIVCYILFLPSVILFYLIKDKWNSNKVVKKISVIIGLIVSSIILLMFSSTIASTKPLIRALVPQLKPVDLLSCKNTKPWLNNENEFNTIFILKNLNSSKVFIELKKPEIQLEIGRNWIYGLKSNPDNIFLERIPITIDSWESVGTTVLPIEPGKRKWVKVSFKLPPLIIEKVKRRQKNDMLYIKNITFTTALVGKQTCSWDGFNNNYEYESYITTQPKGLL